MKKILALLASLGMACAAFAQSYPSHPVRFVVPFPPGSLPDQIARVIGPQLQESLGQPFVIENRPGAIGVIGTAEAARSEEHTSELQSHSDLVCRLLLEKKKTINSPSLGT